MLKKIIGGFLEVSEQSIQEYEKSVLNYLLTVYERKIFYNDGRQIINAILTYFSGKRFNKYYVPSYLGGSILQAYNQNNIAVTFYEIKNHFSYILENNISNSIIFLIDYFGTEKITNNKIKELLDNNIIILDVTHSLFNSERYKIVHPNLFLFSSLGKIFPIPAGSVLFHSDKNFIDEQIASNDHYYMLDLMLKKYFDVKYDLKYDDKIYFDYKRYEQNKDDSIIRSETIPLISKYILSNLGFDKIYRMRRANLNYLYNNIDRKVSIISKDEIKSPFFFPIKLPNLTVRNSLQAELTKNNIYCPIHWILPEIIPRKFNYSYNLSNTILSLPIDQRYNPSDLTNMVDIVNSFIN